MRGFVKFLLVFACALLAASASALTIKTQPKSIMVNAGSTATFSVVITNGTATAYQWFVGTKPLQDGTDPSGAIISGSQTATLTIENLTMDLDLTFYKVAISNASRPLISASARLVVLQGSFIKFDTALGPIIVELFDHDKPATVQNFVHYAYSGFRGNAYLTAFFTRLEKNFVLQGGGYSPIANSLNDLFTNEYFIPDIQYQANYTNEPAFPYIVANESHVGPRIRNTFGTIGMATYTGYPDSAKSEFFFNLGDNSTGSNSLDEINGGYTVFGRVVQGLDVLSAFNNLPSDQVLSYSVNEYPSGRQTFPTLPTKTTDTNNVHVGDLYYTSISFVTRPVIDLVPPTIRITYPRPNAKLTNGDIVFRGTAADNLCLATVTCVNGYFHAVGPDFVDVETSYTPVNGTKNWSMGIHLTPGPWLFTFRASDGFGNWKEASEKITVLDPLTVQTNGKGTVFPNYNGQFLEPQKIYTMTAKPGPGQIFAYWTGTRNDQQWNFPYNDNSWAYDTNGIKTGPSYGPFITTPRMKFTMYTNLTITANFVSNYFPVVQGTYYGLMAPSDQNNTTVSNTGLVKISSSSVGSFSGTLSMLGKMFPFSGKWDYAGNASGVVIKRFGMSNLVANLSIDLSNNLQVISGTISAPDWTSDVTANQAIKKLTTNTVPAPGNYVMTFPAQPANSDLGDSFATVTVSPVGTVLVRGLMADNTAWTESVGVDQAGHWPLFASLYGGQGLVAGLENFADSSMAQWIRPAVSNAYHANGFATGAFNNRLDRYVRPVPNSTFTLRLGGNTLTEVDFSLQVSPTGQFKVMSGNGKFPSLVLTAATGTLSGTWTDDSNQRWTLKGVFRSPALGGKGFILGPHGQTGYLQIDPAL